MTTILSEDKIRELKEKHSEIYLTSLRKGVDVVFKALTVNEYGNALDVALKESSADAEEFVIQTAVLFPEELDLDDYSIGEITALSDEILEQSGFSDYEVCISKIDAARDKASEVVSFMIAMIIASEQGYTDGQLRDMTFSAVAEKAAMAEKIFEIKQQMANGAEIILDVKNPNEAAEEAKPKPAFTPEEFEAIRRGEYVNPERASTIGAATTEDPIARKLQQALR